MSYVVIENGEDSLTWKKLKLAKRNDGAAIVNAFLEKPMARKFEFVYDLLSKEKLLFKIRKISHKSAELAIRYLETGKDVFVGKQNDLRALRLFTNSVAVAPADSYELALAYANRSAVLFRLGRFGSALVDVNRALKMDCPESLGDELQHLKRECISRIRDGKASESCIGLLLANKPVTLTAEAQFDENISDVNYDWKLTHPVTNFNNELLPDASEKVKLHQTEEMGRHLIAAEDILPGEMIYSTKSYMWALFELFYHTHCSNCVVRCEILIPCPGCRQVMFCGERCRNEALNLYHRIECEYLSVVRPPIVGQNNIEVLTLRVLMKATKQGTKLCELMEHPIFSEPFTKNGFDVNVKLLLDDYLTIHNLEDNFAKMPNITQFKKAVTAAVLVDILKRTSFLDYAHQEKNISITDPRTELTEVQCYLGTLVMKLLCVIEFNSCSLKEKSEAPDLYPPTNSVVIGNANFILQSFVNHSCNPNTFKVTYKNHMLLYTFQPIACGDPIFDAYGVNYLRKNLSERQTYLKKKHYFHCGCKACRWNWPTFSTLPDENPDKSLTYLSGNVDRKKLKKSSEYFRKLLEKYLLLQSNVDNEWDFIREHMIFLHRSIRRPCYDDRYMFECKNDFLWSDHFLDLCEEDFDIPKQIKQEIHQLWAH